MTPDLRGLLDAGDVHEWIAQVEAEAEAGLISPQELAELNRAGFPWTQTFRDVYPHLVSHGLDLANRHGGTMHPYYDGDPDYASALELANGSDPVGAVELAMTREAGRLAEDAAEHGTPHRRGSTEHRLATALERIARGTYLPPAGIGAVQLASGTEHGRALARMRWDRQADEAAAVSIGPICGAPDPVGRCSERYHSAGCSSLADMASIDSPDLRAAMADITSRPWMDAAGRVFLDQYGQPMDLTGHIEAATGERLGGPSFADRAELGIPATRETLQPQRLPRFADLDGGDPGHPVPPQAAALAGMIRHQDPSLRGRTAAEARATGQRRQAAALAQAAAGRAPLPNLDPGAAFDMGTRRERVRQAAGLVQPAPLSQPGDGLAGAQPQYTAGQLL